MTETAAQQYVPAGLGCGLGWAGLGWVGLGWVQLGSAGSGWIALTTASDIHPL